MPGKAEIALPAPIHSGVDLLIVAGEHSGDQHAARLVRQLQAQKPGLRIAALGGPELARAGAQLLFDLTESSVVGLVEVLKNYGFFKSLFDNTVAWIAEHKPRAVCFVDYPGFNLRLAEKLHRRGISRKGGGDVALFYYISPQIWAWKAKRRFKMARLLDAMAVIFPFEVESYRDTDLPVRFVGHPFVSEGHEAHVRYDAAGEILLLPGSRVQPVSRIFPVMLDGFEAFLKQRPGEKAVALYPEAPIKAVLEQVLATRSDSLRRAVELRPASAGALAKACLISSGTMSLSCALAGIPGGICYRAHPLTYMIGKRLVKVPYLGIANLLLPETPPYPEYIQNAARPDVLARELASAIDDPTRRLRSAEAAALLTSNLSASSAHDAAAWLLEFLK